MVVTHSPKQTLAVCWLWSNGGEAFVDTIRPSLAKSDRDALVNGQLIRVEKRTRQSGKSKRATAVLHAELTDAGWLWAAEHLDAEISTRSPASAPILRIVLGKLKVLLKNTGVSLAEFVASVDAPQEYVATTTASTELAELTKSTPTEIQPTDVVPVSSQVLSACLQQSGQQGARVYLSEVREQFNHLTRGEVDAALSSLERTGSIVLYPLDNPQGASNHRGQPPAIIGASLNSC